MATGPLTGVGVGESSTNGRFVPGGRRRCALAHVGQLPLKQEVAPPVGPVLYSQCKHRVPLNSQSTAGSDLDTGKKINKKQGAFTDAGIFNRCKLNAEAVDGSHYRRTTWKVRGGGCNGCN